MHKQDIPPNTVLFIWDSDAQQTEGDSYALQMDAVPRIGDTIWLKIDEGLELRGVVYDVIWNLDHSRDTPFHEVRIYF